MSTTKEQEYLQIINRLYSNISQLDCRYAGKYMELSGCHCSFKNPCDRCIADNTIKELENKLEEKLKFSNLLEKIENQLSFEYHDLERAKYELENMSVKRLLEMLSYMDDE